MNFSQIFESMNGFSVQSIKVNPFTAVLAFANRKNTAWSEIQLSRDVYINLLHEATGIKVQLKAMLAFCFYDVDFKNYAELNEQFPYLAMLEFKPLAENDSILTVEMSEEMAQDLDADGYMIDEDTPIEEYQVIFAQNLIKGSYANDLLTAQLKQALLDSFK